MIYKIKRSIYTLRRKISLKTKKEYTIKGIKLFNDFSYSLKILKQLDGGRYESQERTLVEKYISVNDNVLELGGGMGYISLVLTKIIGVKPEKIFVFEANPSMCKIISKNHALNGINGVNIINRVLGHGEDERKFRISKSFTGSSLRGDKNHKSVSVKQEDFTQFLLGNNINAIILDIEGGEYELFYDGYSIPDNVTKVCIEIHPGKNSENIDIISNFTKCGFQIIEQNSDVYYLERKPV